MCFLVVFRWKFRGWGVYLLKENKDQSILGVRGVTVKQIKINVYWEGYSKTKKKTCSLWLVFGGGDLTCHGMCVTYSVSLISHHASSFRTQLLPRSL